MIRFRLALYCVFAIVALIAAGPSPSLLGTPVLFVYPFAANGSDVTKEAGSRLAVTIATQISNLGGVNVKPAPPGIERQAYLASAQQAGADYYIAGYVTPLGDGVSVVEQLVSVQAGIVVYSNTAQVRTFEDAAGQGDVLREALLRHQTRNLGAYAAPPPPATIASPTPAPGSATQANLGRLFGHKQRRSAQPAATAAPAARIASTPSRAGASTTPTGPVPAARATSAPVAGATSTSLAGAAAPVGGAAASAGNRTSRGAGFGMLAIGGTAETARRAFTLAAIRNVMLANRRRVAMDDATDRTACPDAVGTLLGGNLATRNHTVLGQAQTIATLEFLAYDCTGSVVYRKTFARDARGDWKTAVDGVVQRAVAEFLSTPAGARRT